MADNHSSNFAGFTGLMEHFGRNNEPFQSVGKLPTHLPTLYGCALYENFSEQLVISEKTTFPSFISKPIGDEVKIDGWEVYWNWLHRIYEKDQQNQANSPAPNWANLTSFAFGELQAEVHIALVVFDFIYYCCHHQIFSLSTRFSWLTSPSSSLHRGPSRWQKQA